MLDRPIIQLKEKSIPQQSKTLAQPKISSKFPLPESSQIYGKIITVPNYVIPQTRSGNDSSSREIPMYLDPIYRPPS